MPPRGAPGILHCQIASNYDPPVETVQAIDKTNKIDVTEGSRLDASRNPVRWINSLMHSERYANAWVGSRLGAI